MNAPRGGQLMHSRLKLDIGWAALLWAATGAPVSTRGLNAARARLTEAFGGEAIVVGLSVRTIFDAILADLALPAGSPVVMSGVNIQNMADIVRGHGLSIRAVDIGADTLSPPPGALLRAQEGSGARLCVVAQLFGAVVEIEDGAALRARGVLVLEDAAQAFSGAFHRGVDNVDVSLFSFGPIKRHTALGGAVAIFRNPALAARIQARLDSYLPRSEMWFRRRAFKYLILRALSTPLAYAALVRLIATLGKDPDTLIGGVARGFTGPSLVASIRAKPPRRLMALLARQVERLDDLRVRQTVCREVLDALPSAAAVGAHVERNAYWLMPVLAKNPGALIACLRLQGFDATRGKTSLCALDPNHTPVARDLMASVVYLPHPVGLNAGARKRLRDVTAAALTGDAAAPADGL
jgi:perosamine synthetase